VSLKDEHFAHLKTLIKNLFGVQIAKDRGRNHYLVNVKMIYAQILFEAGYGCSAISKSMNMHHATILYYFKNFKWYIKTDPQLHNNYSICKSEFNKTYDPTYYLSEHELKKEVISMKIEKELLSSELETVHSKLNKAEEREMRFKKLFDLIEERTKVGTEETVLYKLNQFYNGVYNR
jgi:hypothetical protein